MDPYDRKKPARDLPKESTPKWKYVATFAILIFVGAALGVYSSMERQLEKTFHQMWLEEEIPYPVESEYTMLTAMSMVGYGLYAIGLDQSSLLYQPLHYLNRIAYESAMKKIPEDDGLRQWFYYYRYYAVPIAKNDPWVELYTEDLLHIVEKLLSLESRSRYLSEDRRYELVLSVFSYLSNYPRIIEEKDLFHKIDSLLETSYESFVLVNPKGIKKEKLSASSETRTLKYFPLVISLYQFHWTVSRDGDAYRNCNVKAYENFIVVYSKIFQIWHQVKDIATDSLERKEIEEMLSVKGELKNRLAKSALDSCHINLDKMEREYEQSRRYGKTSR